MVSDSCSTSARSSFVEIEPCGWQREERVAWWAEEIKAGSTILAGFPGKESISCSDPVGWERKDPRFQSNMWSAISRGAEEGRGEQQRIELIAEVGAAVAMHRDRAANLCESCEETYY